MKILLFLLPLAGLLLVLIAIGFVWAVRSKQFDDMEGPAYRILFDEEDNIPSTDDSSKTSNNSISHEAGDDKSAN